MPPSAVKTIKDVIYWQYAKLISKSAGFDIKDSRGFQMKTFMELKSGKKEWSNTIREYIKEQKEDKKCIYCGSEENLSLEHILPRSRGGEDSFDNTIFICKTCNSKKGAKRLYEFFGEKNRDKIPRIAEGKYLKYLYTLHEKQNTLDSTIKDLCVNCDLKQKCIEEGHPNKLTVYCLEGCFK